MNSNKPIETYDMDVHQQISTDEFTSIHMAISHNSIDAVRNMLQNSVDVNTIDESGTTALISAIEFGNERIVSYLIDNKADVNLPIYVDSIGSIDPLYTAVSRYNTNVACLLINNDADVTRVYTDDSTTALYIAASAGLTQVVELLLAKNAYVDSRERFNQTTALYASASKGHLSLVKLLHEYKANINIYDSLLNRNALFTAVRFNHTDVAAYLITHKADIDTLTYNSYEYQSIHYACANGNLEIVKLLINNNADINRSTTSPHSFTKRKVRVTPLYEACKNGHPEVVQYLLEKNADIKSTNSVHKHTPFWTAILNNNIPVMSVLLQHDPSVYLQKNTFNRTVLHAASGAKSVQILEYILDYITKTME